MFSYAPPPETSRLSRCALFMAMTEVQESKTIYTSTVQLVACISSANMALTQASHRVKQSQVYKIYPQQEGTAKLQSKDMEV